MALETTDTISQFFRVFRQIIELPQQDVLKTDAATGDVEVVAAVLQQDIKGIGMGRGDQLLP